MRNTEKSEIYLQHKKFFTDAAIKWLICVWVISFVLLIISSVINDLFSLNLFSLLYCPVEILIGFYITKKISGKIEMTEQYQPFQFNLAVMLVIISNSLSEILSFVVEWLTPLSVMELTIMKISQFGVSLVVCIIDVFIFRFLLSIPDNSFEKDERKISKILNIVLIALIVLQALSNSFDDTTTYVVKNVLITASYIAVVLIWFFSKRSTKFYRYVPAIIVVASSVAIEIISMIRLRY